MSKNIKYNALVEKSVTDAQQVKVDQVREDLKGQVVSPAQYKLDMVSKKTDTDFKRYGVSKGSVAKRSLTLGIAVNDADYCIQYRNDNGKMKCPIYAVWANMIDRCYNGAFHKTNPTYTGCSVHPDWLLFSNFAKWMEQQDFAGRFIDKDIIREGNKTYSAETCIFVTRAVNNLLLDHAAKRGDYPLGVSYCKTFSKYSATCGTEGKSKSLGYFLTPAGAAIAYNEFKAAHVTSIANEYKTSEPRLFFALRRHALKFTTKAEEFKLEEQEQLLEALEQVAS